MGVLKQFERRLEGAVEGFFARAFRSGVQPIELAKAVQRYGEDRQHITSDGVVVPNVYRVTVGTKDHDRLAGFGASLPRELAEVVAKNAAERGWILLGPARVRIEVDDEVRLGRFRLAGRVEAVEGRHVRAGFSAGGSRPSPHLSGPQRPSASADHRAGISRTQTITGPSADLYLVILQNGIPGPRIPLTGGRLTAGRLASSDVHLDDSTVSREHAAFVRRGDAWWVVDLGSTNGTRVNGRQAAEHPLRPSDRIELGDALVELVEG